MNNSICSTCVGHLEVHRLDRTEKPDERVDCTIFSEEIGFIKNSVFHFYYETKICEKFKDLYY